MKYVKSLSLIFLLGILWIIGLILQGFFWIFKSLAMTMQNLIKRIYNQMVKIDEVVSKWE